MSVGRSLRRPGIIENNMGQRVPVTIIPRPVRTPLSFNYT